MGKSQARRLRNATRRFGLENRNLLTNTRANLAILTYERKKEAGLISPAASGSASTGQALVKRYSTKLTHSENENRFGRTH